MRKVYLLTCTKRKLNRKAPAKDLYCSPTFQANRKIAEKFGDIWYILSAKHGLISPESKIEPYDQNLSSLSNFDQIRWAKKVFQTLYPKLKIDDRIIILGDSTYAEHLAPLIRNAGLILEEPSSNNATIESKLQWRRKIGLSIETR